MVPEQSLSETHRTRLVTTSGTHDDTGKFDEDLGAGKLAEPTQQACYPQHRSGARSLRSEPWVPGCAVLKMRYTSSGVYDKAVSRHVRRRFARDTLAVPGRMIEAVGRLRERLRRLAPLAPPWGFVDHNFEIQECMLLRLIQ